MAPSMATTKLQQYNIEDRRKRVAANLLAGLTYREMADALGVSIGTIARDVTLNLERLHRESILKTDAAVTLDLRRIDRIINAIWTKVVDGNLQAIDRMIKLLERRAKLLGLDAPVVREVTGRDGGSIRIEYGELTEEERIRRLGELLHRVRTRRIGLPAEDRPELLSPVAAGDGADIVDVELVTTSGRLPATGRSDDGED